MSTMKDDFITITVVIVASVILLSISSQYDAYGFKYDIVIEIGSALSAHCSYLQKCTSPDNMVVPTHSAIEWTNNDINYHTITSGNPLQYDVGKQFDSGLIPPQGTFTDTFNNSGKYYYFCQIHPWIRGQIVAQ